MIKTSFGRSQSFRQALLCYHYHFCVCMSASVWMCIIRLFGMCIFWNNIYTGSVVRLISQRSIYSVHYHLKADAEPRCFHWTLEWFVLVFNNKCIYWNHEAAYCILVIGIKFLQPMHGSIELTVHKQWNLMFKTFDVMLSDWMLRSCSLLILTDLHFDLVVESERKET